MDHPADRRPDYRVLSVRTIALAALGLVVVGISVAAWLLMAYGDGTFHLVLSLGWAIANIHTNDDLGRVMDTFAVHSEPGTLLIPEVIDPDRTGCLPRRFTINTWASRSAPSPVVWRSTASAPAARSSPA